MIIDTNLLRLKLIERENSLKNLVQEKNWKGNFDFKKEQDDLLPIIEIIEKIYKA